MSTERTRVLLRLALLVALGLRLVAHELQDAGIGNLPADVLVPPRAGELPRFSAPQDRRVGDAQALRNFGRAVPQLLSLVAQPLKLGQRLNIAFNLIRLIRHD